MGTAQRVRVRPASGIARDWDIPPEATGTVICRYRLLAGAASAPERLDVSFSKQTVIWGGRADDFEVIGNFPDQDQNS